MVSFLEKKLRSSQGLIDDVLSELRLTDEDDIDDKAELESEVKKLRENLNQVEKQLEARKVELLNNQKQLEALNKIGTEIITAAVDIELLVWEAQVHTAVTFTGFFVIVGLVWNVCKGDKIRRANVPIKWVGFFSEENDKALPLHKE
mmetsp:Transcript_17672/g.21486  ORF Transcript_17672/g.21486 Transcript_17672/m.21486 type:complete len:147 (+) Transcript_17672:1490-1930(+)